MAASRIRADYEQLEHIAQAMSQQAETCRRMMEDLQRSNHALQSSGWAGHSATAFQARMDSAMLPSLNKLTAVLEQSSQATLKIVGIFQRAEAEAAAIFRGDDGTTAAGLPQWLTELLEGVFLGDFSEGSSLLKLLAQLGVGFVPVAGQVADVRDIIANVKNVIQGKELAWVGLALAILAIIPGLDALKAGKALKPIFKALGDKGSREAVEFLLKNPKELGRVGRTLGALLDHPQLIEALAENPEAALRLIREGSPEVVEAYARYGEYVSKILNDIPDPHRAYEGFARLTPQRPLDAVPGTDLTPKVEEFVTPGVHGDFDDYPFGIRGDERTKLLWTIDDQGAHFVPENTLRWDSSRGRPSHTNMSDAAYFGGEAWRTGPNEITINAGSGAFGYNRNYANSLTGEALDDYLTAMQARFDRAAEYFRQLGFEVKQIPVTQR